MLLLALPQGAQQFASPLCPGLNVTFQLGHCDTYKNSTILCAHIVQQSMCIVNLQHHAYMPAYYTLQSHHHACHFVLLLMCFLVAQWHSPYQLVVGFQPELFLMLLSFLKHTHNTLDIGNW